MTGGSPSINLLQKIGKTAAYGLFGFCFGPNTLKCLNDYVSKHGVEDTIKNFQEARQGYYEKLSTFDTFGRGWTRRVTETTELALTMV